MLGPATLAALHQRVGGTVTLTGGSLNVRLKIAGTATMPAIGGVLSVHPSMSTGAMFSTAVLPAIGLDGIFGRLPTGPNAILVRLRPGVSAAAGLRSMQAIRGQLTAVLNSPRALAASGGGSIADTIDLLQAQRPAEIVNYRSMGDMPAVLAGGLAAGAVTALGLTLVASVRRRRRDFALLKTLGFTRGQLAAAVAWQSSAIAVIGLVAGVPLGIAAGRWLWLTASVALAAARLGDQAGGYHQAARAVATVAVPVVIAVSVHMLLALPDGRLVERGRRIGTGLAYAVAGAAGLVLAVAGRPFPAWAVAVAWPLAAACALPAVRLRYLAASAPDRQRMQWMAVGAVLAGDSALVVLVLHVLVGWPGPVAAVAAGCAGFLALARLRPGRRPRQPRVHQHGRPAGRHRRLGALGVGAGPRDPGAR